MHKGKTNAKRLSGSEAEERIRVKVEAALRVALPTARIIHELVLAQGQERIDVAAVTETRLVVVEIKSERDVLKRLERQVMQAKRVADLVVAVVADKHFEKAKEIAGYFLTIVEADVADLVGGYRMRHLLEATCNSPARLDMLWASELRIVAGTEKKATRSFSIRKASDNLTGSEVRRRVCAALRARHFPRADPPITSDLFQAPSVFMG